MSQVDGEPAGRESSPAAAGLDEAGQEAPPSVLVVDDSAVNRVILRELLQKERIAIIEAADGERALDLARTRKPDLILLDVMMPRTDGFQVCAALKADAQTRDIPVLFLSALSDASDRVRGLALGAVDYIGKPFSGAEVLARVRQQLHLQRLTRKLLAANQSLREKQALLDADLNAAAVIQRSLTAVNAPRVEGLAIASRFLPCSQIGGDVFNFIRLDASRVAFYVADVSGHGVPAGMVTVWVSHSMVPQVGHVVARDLPGGRVAIRSPSEVLARLDSAYPMDRFERYFTIAYLILNLETGQLSASTAAHPSPLILRSDGGLEELAAGGPFIGLGGMVPFEETEITLAAGDRIFLCTDGILEYENPEGEFYGEERFRDVLLRTRGRPLEEVCDAVIAGLSDFGRGQPMQDDVTLVAIEFTAGGRRQPVASGPRLALAIDSNLAAIAPAVDALCEFYESTRVGRAELDALELAVSEALANTIWHSCHNEPGHLVEIDAFREPERMVVRVRDHGEPFEPPAPVLPKEDLTDRSTLAESGRGMFLMHAVSDEVLYTRDGDANVLTLIKRVGPA